MFSGEIGPQVPSGSILENFSSSNKSLLMFSVFWFIVLAIRICSDRQNTSLYHRTKAGKQGSAYVFVISAQCDEKWVAFKSRCFYFSKKYENETNYELAERKCRKMHNGSRMAAIANKEENNFVKGKFWMLLLILIITWILRIWVAMLYPYTTFYP